MNAKVLKGKILRGETVLGTECNDTQEMKRGVARRNSLGFKALRKLPG
jgi:hypothetical protein